MAVSLTHSTVAVGEDAGNGEIRKAQWNEGHTLSMATARLLGRTTADAGAVEELTAGAGLSLATGSLAADVATDANIQAGTANKLIAAGQIYTANAPVATSGTGTYTIDLTAGRVFQRTMTGNTTLANPTTEVAGQSGVIYFIQDATGGFTLSLESDWKPIGGTPSIDTTANKVNVFSYYVRAASNISLTYLGAE
jgi:hypothetical protein